MPIPLQLAAGALAGLALLLATQAPVFRAPDRPPLCQPPIMVGGALKLGEPRPCDSSHRCLKQVCERLAGAGR